MRWLHLARVFYVSMFRDFTRKYVSMIILYRTNTMHIPENDPLSLLPHGEGFRFIDELISLDPGKSAAAIYRVKGDEFFFHGHFPGNPIVPGVILIEALAQLGGVLAQSDPQIAVLENLKLTAVKQAKILGSAKPGAELLIRARLL